jgi:chromosome segregation ATPase
MSYSIAFTIPEEDRDNYISEDDFREMTKSFNSHLRNYSVQSDELIKQINTLKLKLERELQRNTGLRSSITETNQRLKQIESDTQVKAARLAELESLIHTESVRPVSSCNLNKSEFETKIESSSTFEIQAEIQGLIEYARCLELSSVILQTEQELISKKIMEKQFSLTVEVKCAKCKEMYVPIRNNNTACAYHNGTLKYFSCRGCGNEAYYDCCMRCKLCSKGCKVSQHSS